MSMSDAFDAMPLLEDLRAFVDQRRHQTLDDFLVGDLARVMPSSFEWRRSSSTTADGYALRSPAL
jgi:hypothetical protein